MSECPHGGDPALCPPCQSPPVGHTVRRIPAIDERTWTGAEAARIAGLTYRIVDRAAREGRVAPTIAADGTGTTRGYTLADIVKLRVLFHLRRITNTPYDVLPALLVTGSASVGPLRVEVDLDKVRTEVERRLEQPPARREGPLDG